MILNRLSRLFSMVFLMLSSLAANPSIQFDTKTFEFGTLSEGKVDVVKAVFNVKNKGDAVLKLKTVRPSCGCVVVKYDSAVGPGATGQIEAFMNTKGFHSGPVTKWIEISSNAQNEPTVRLTIKAVFQACLDVLKKTYLSFNAARSGKDTLYIATKKSDFKIVGAEFRASDNTMNDPGWQATLPLTLKYCSLKTDSTRKDGYRVFTYELVPPVFKYSQTGYVTIKTNLPEKPEIILMASLLK